MSIGQAWSDAENVAVCALYFAMLDAATAGTAYNKRAMIRAVQNNHAGPIDSGLNTAPLRTRSKGSVEAKLMNCTAAHASLSPDAVTMDGFGYRGLSRYQGALRVAMGTAIAQRTTAALRTRNAALSA